MDKVTDNLIILFRAIGELPFPSGFVQKFHTHLFCHSGSIRFSFNNKHYTCGSGEFVFWFADSNVTDVCCSEETETSLLLVERNFLNDNIPNQSWSIDALLHSRENPVLYMKEENDKHRVLLNFQLLFDKFSDKNHRFYHEVLKLQMQVFVFEMWNIFANEYDHRKRTLESGSLYERFLRLLEDNCLKEREVQFYAEGLHITAKYLNYVCKQNTGVTASEWIHRYVKERLILLLQNKHVNISAIADDMNFSSRSFFTRYVKKLIGVTPSEYRNGIDARAYS